jgi:hypothetical protein
MKEIETERDEAKEDRDEKIIGRAKLERQIKESATKLASTQKELEKVKTNTEELAQEKEDAVKENKRLKEETQDLDRRLKTEQNDKKLFDKIDCAIQAVQEAEENGDEEAANGAQEELEKLLPLYEQQKTEYRKMITDYMETLEEDHAMRIPLEGLIDISEAESRHQTRVSEVLQFHKDLKTPYLELIKEELEDA